MCGINPLGLFHQKGKSKCDKAWMCVTRPWRNLFLRRKEMKPGSTHPLPIIDTTTLLGLLVCILQYQYSDTGSIEAIEVEAITHRLFTNERPTIDDLQGEWNGHLAVLARKKKKERGFVLAAHWTTYVFGIDCPAKCPIKMEYVGFDNIFDNEGILNTLTCNFYKLIMGEYFALHSECYLLGNENIKIHI